MTILATTPELITYKKQIERQLSILLVSPVFTASEKDQIRYIYSNFIDICNKRIEIRKQQNLDALNGASL